VSKPELKAGEFTQQEIEDLFAKVADERIKQARTEWEAEQVKSDESKKTALRAEFMEAFAANQGNTSKGIDDKSPMDLLGMYTSAIAVTVNMSKSTEAGRDLKKVLKSAKDLYPSAKNFHALIEKQQKDLEASIPSAGGFTIPTVLSPDIIRVLYAKTVLDKLGVVKIPMPSGNLKMSRMDVSSGVFLGSEIPSGNKTEPVFGDASLSAKKLTALVPVSNSLLRYNAVGLDSWVSQDLQTKARIALDLAMMNGTGTSNQPKGLANQGVQTIGSSVTAFGLATPNDMYAKLAAANTPMINPGWILNPLGESKILSLAFSSGPFAWANEMNVARTLRSVPFAVSSSVQTYGGPPATYADYWLGDFSELLWGVSYDLSLEISREGSYSVGGTSYNAFERDETLIRLICEHDFNVRHATSFVQGTYTI